MAAKVEERIGEASPKLDVELTWVDDAVAAAKALADKTGWESVPWEALLVELIAMEPNPATPE